MENKELIYNIDSVSRSGNHTILFQLSTRDEYTIQQLEKKHKHKLTYDGFKYYFAIQFHISELKTLDDARMWDSVKDIVPDMARSFVLARIKGEI